MISSILPLVTCMFTLCVLLKYEVQNQTQTRDAKAQEWKTLKNDVCHEEERIQSERKI